MRISSLDGSQKKHDNNIQKSSCIQNQRHNYSGHFITDLQSAMSRTEALMTSGCAGWISVTCFCALIQVVLQIHDWPWVVASQKWQKCLNLRDYVLVICLELSQGFYKVYEQVACEHRKIPALISLQSETKAKNLSMFASQWAGGQKFTAPEQDSYSYNFFSQKFFFEILKKKTNRQSCVHRWSICLVSNLKWNPCTLTWNWESFTLCQKWLFITTNILNIFN